MIPRWCIRLPLILLAAVSANCYGAEAGLPASTSPLLDQAAAALASGQLDLAVQQFDQVRHDLAQPAFVRALAGLGLAEAALAKQDRAQAAEIWQQMSDDSGLPQLHRDIAKRRLVESERPKSGLPGRDPGAYRASLPSLPDSAVTFHVAPGGSDAADGSAARPFATLAKARDAVREVKRQGGGSLPKGGARVLIEGAFQVEQSLRLDAQDSGTAEAPVVYQAQPGQQPVLAGGATIRGWRPVSDPAMRERLDRAVREKVLEADLKASGVSDWGDATDLKHRPELFAEGEAQTLARWPNAGFVKTGDALGKEPIREGRSITGSRDGVFRFLEDRPARWLDEPDVRLYGYWFWDWYEEYQKVAAIDAEKRTFTLARPYSSYGYRKDQRYFALNVFRELDEPGEWYLDRRGGRIYWLPPEGLDPAKARTVVSVTEQPLVILDNVSHVVLLGLTFQEGRGDGLHVRGGSDCLVAGCTFQRFGGDAIVIQGGQRHGVFGCDMRTLGCGGMRIDGGDRRSLSPGHHFVENCTVSDISRIKRTYTPAVHLDGCGHRVAHNLFERIPSSAMRIEGNDHLVELNRIRHVVQESDDQGGIDMFGNPLYRGVVIRWNRWSDIRGGTQCGAAAIRLDDMICGTAVYGNLFERCGAVLFGAVQIHGGKENLVDGNVFVDCYAGLSFSRWGEGRWLKAIEPFLTQAGAEPYATRYPGLAQLKSGPDVNDVSRNLLVRTPRAFLRDGGSERAVLNQAHDWPGGLDAILAEPSHQRALRQMIFEPIPLGEIGPYPHPWRAQPN